MSTTKGSNGGSYRDELQCDSAIGDKGRNEWLAAASSSWTECLKDGPFPRDMA